MSRYRSVIGLTALSLAVLVTPQPAAAQGTGIAIKPGLTVRCSIYGASDSNGRFLGDYDVVNRVTDVSGGGYRYTFLFNGPAASKGWISVSEEDRKKAIITREFLPAGDQTSKGKVGLALSDATFTDLKNGKETALESDGPDSPRSLKPVGFEDLTTLIDEKPTRLHTIKVAVKTGGTYWVLDNADIPLLFKGEAKYKWMITAISTADTADRKVVADLRATGAATTHAILFAFNSAEIEPDSKSVIDAVARYLKATPAVHLEIQGHTDNIGGAQVNLSLSEKRAAAVKAYLVSAGVDVVRLSSKGYGLTVPVADNATLEGRALNRRVIFRQR